MIRLEEVAFRYPDAPAPVVEDLHLHAEEGELLLVAGATGSGKSTLLRMPCGLVPRYSGGIFSGRVLLGGRDVTGCAPRDVVGEVGFVAQDPEAHATADRVLPELAFALENLGTPQARMRKRIEEACDQLGIAHLRDRRLDTLSGGERQRVAVAAVLCMQPRVLVCDEPTSALDPQSAEDVLAVLTRLRDDLGLTIVLAEHRLERVAGACDRVAYLSADGVSSGPPREVFRTAPFAPPVAMLGRSLGWEPLPLTVREGRPFARDVRAAPPSRAEVVDAPAVLGCTNLRVEIAGREVLRGVSAGIAPGAVTALVGRNGSGKTTLVRTLAGLVRPSGGHVLHAGVLDGRGPRELARRVAYVPQRAEALLFRDTVGAELNAAGSSEAVGRWLDRLGLEAVADRHPWTLSAGQRLHAALGTAFARAPDAYLLDEPTRGLDPQAKARLCDLLRAEARRGAAVLLVTHDVELVAAGADRVLMLADGEIVADGPAHEVLGESLLFSSQTSKIMRDPRFLVPDDVVAGLQTAVAT